VSVAGTPVDEVLVDEVAEGGVSEAGVAFVRAVAEAFLSAAVAGVAALADWADRTKTPGLALPGASPVIAVIRAGDCVGGSGFEVRFDVTDGTLLLATLLARLSERLLAAANPVSGALADWADTAVASAESAGADAGLGSAEPRVGSGRAAARLIGVEFPALRLLGVELLTLGSVELGSAGNFAFGGSVRGARLLSLRGGCRVGVGVAAGEEDSCEKMFKAG
jgi:hypothetical protein